jgi:hypothetical protein
MSDLMSDVASDLVSERLSDSPQPQPQPQEVRERGLRGGEGGTESEGKTAPSALLPKSRARLWAMALTVGRYLGAARCRSSLGRVRRTTWRGVWSSWESTKSVTQRRSAHRRRGTPRAVGVARRLSEPFVASGFRLSLSVPCTQTALNEPIGTGTLMNSMSYEFDQRISNPTVRLAGSHGDVVPLMRGCYGG